MHAAVAVRKTFSETRSVKSLTSPTHSEQQTHRMHLISLLTAPSCTSSCLFPAAHFSQSLLFAAMLLSQAQLCVHCAEQAQADMVCGHWACGELERPPDAHGAGAPCGQHAYLRYVCVRWVVAMWLPTLWWICDNSYAIKLLQPFQLRCNHNANI